MHDFTSDSLFGKRIKRQEFSDCFQTFQCSLCMDCLWVKATSLFGTAVLLTWSKGKASASGHYHYHLTIFLPACYMGFPLQIFFCIFCADWFILLIPGKISTGKCTRLMRKRGQLHSLLVLKVFPFCWRLLLFLWCWLTLFIFIGSWLFITFCRNLHSAANSPSSQLLAFTQPKENSIACFSWEFSNSISWQKKMRRCSYLIFSWFFIFALSFHVFTQFAI